jgi:hypothetical protein
VFGTPNISYIGTKIWIRCSIIIEVDRNYSNINEERNLLAVNIYEILESRVFYIFRRPHSPDSGNKKHISNGNSTNARENVLVESDLDRINRII